jgi:hypothetical protein
MVVATFLMATINSAISGMSKDIPLLHFALLVLIIFESSEV